MLFFTFDSGTSAKQILEDIDKTLRTVLDLCNSNKNHLEDTERTNFLNNHTRLSYARGQLTESTKCSKLSKILGECESLKMKINRTCLEHREKEIRKILARSLASAPSTPLVVTSKSPKNSLPDTASSVTPQFKDSSHTSPTIVHRAQGGSNFTFIQQHFSDISKLVPPELLTQLELRVEETSRTLSNAPAALAIKLPARNFESECMIFNGTSVVKSPTMNIDSPNAVGATYVYDGARPAHNSPSPTPAAEIQSLPRIPTWRERCMTFEDGVADDPTMNIRSPGASGAFSQIIPRPEELNA